MRSNPMIRKGFSNTLDYDGQAMTTSGTRTKTLLLTGITFVCALLTFVGIFMFGTIDILYPISISSGIAGLILALCTCFKPHLARKTSAFYALCEGIFIGSISLIFELYIPGIVTHALILTLLAVVFTLLLYREAPGLARKIRKGVMIATLCVLSISLLGLVFNLLGIGFILGGATPLGIGFSLIVVVIAIANLFIDYDNIALGVEHGLPDYMEWYFAFGILVTVVWIYLELLSLLSKFASRD